MKSQTPDIIWPDAYMLAKAIVSEAQDALIEATAYLDSVRKRALIKCCSCHSEHPIAEQEYVQTYWYTSPHGCTGGDYWNFGEANWICPSCGFRNRFNAVKDKEIVALQPMFKSTYECHCEYNRTCSNCVERGRRMKKADSGEWMPKGVLDEWQRKARAHDRLVAWLVQLEDEARRNGSNTGRLLALQIRTVLESSNEPTP